MSDRSKVCYITRGRNWARGWHKYEAETMGWLRGILIIASALGLVGGVLLSLGLSLSWWLILVAVFSISFIGLFIGIAIAKLVIPFIWDLKVQKWQEEQ